MIGFLKNLLRRGDRLNMKELLAREAVIVDVRTEKEFKTGHVNGAINIPLEKLNKNISNLKRDKPIITCCASGLRSATAKNILRNNGFAEVYNAGSWTMLRFT